MTSNVGSDLIRKDSRVGFAVTSDEDKTAEDRYRRMKGRVEEEMKRVFRPEFINRIDQHVVFHALQPDHIRVIVDLQLNDLRANLADKNMTLQVTDELLDYLGKEGFDEIFGARPLRSVIQNKVEDPLSDAMLDSVYTEGDSIKIDYVDDEIKIERADNLISESNENPEIAADSNETIEPTEPNEPEPALTP